MSEAHQLGVVIGRFQPLHKAHLSEVLLPAINQTDTLLILLGSSQRPRTPKDPWTDSDRAEMIWLGFKDSGLKLRRLSEFCFADDDKTILIMPIRDSAYSNTSWQLGVQESVRQAVESIKELSSEPIDVDVSLFGVDRDESTFYLDMFPQWKSKTLIRNGKEDVVNGTMCRDLIFTRPDFGKETWSDNLVPSVTGFIDSWLKSDAYRGISEEYFFLKHYKAEMSKIKYPVIFQTADNIILWKGHILLANRRSFPGKGLWALPGGFVNVDKSVQQSAIDNARDKTKLQLKPDWLVTSKVYDAPKRSLRGRTITTAYLWKLPDSFSFDIEAGKNTNKVKWFQFCDVLQMSSVLYEDHYDIIADMLSNVK